jgi:hypothetical protein
MLRGALTAAFVLALASCAHERSRDPAHPVAASASDFIIEAIAPADDGDQYRWEAFTARVSGSMQWSAPPGTTPEGGVRREGRLRGSGLGVVATGDATYVTALSIDANAVHGQTMLDALRANGRAEVTFQGDYESYSEYVITPAGADIALLTTNSTCIPFDPQPGEVCRNYVTLTFSPW